MATNQHPGDQGITVMNLTLGQPRTFAITGLLSLPLLGLATAPSAPPSRLEIRAEAAPSLNPDADGRALSVVVCVFQLKDRLEFCKLTFDQVASGRSETELLGADCLGRRDFILVPGSVHKATEDFLPGSRYVGVVALFRSPDAGHWRCLARIEAPPPPAPAPPKKSWLKRAFTKRPKPEPPAKHPELAFVVQECRLRLVAPQAEPIPEALGADR